ncbi:MAG: M81 family metallopeptidase [Actinobacteria bacterium]|nr:M81 family metallopeptidase [Actinomycetota bacterium]
MRVAVGGVFQETSTYATAFRGTAKLDAFDLLRGSELLDGNRGTATEVGGAIAAAEAAHVRLSPTMLAIASPGPTIDGATYRQLRDELVARIAREAEHDLDGVLLVLHGAGVAEGVDSIEVDLVRHLRRAVGDVPIAATLDLHGNLGAEWSSLVDVSLPCRTYPHVDLAERGADAVASLARISREHPSTVTANVAVPVLCTNGRTDQPLMQTVADWCADAARDPGVLDVSILHGFPYTDVPENGMHVLVTRVDGDLDAATTTAVRIASELWRRRDELRGSALGAVAAVRMAMDFATTASRPVVINENSDNPGGGAPGDGTHLLRALLDGGVADACFACIADPDVVAQAHAAGVGTCFDTALGGRHGSLHGEPLHVNARVMALTDGRWTASGPIATGAQFTLGPSACLRIGGVDVIVSTKAEQIWDPAPFHLHGVDPTRRRIVAVKSSTHFRAAFAPLAEAIVTADPPGLTALDVTCLPRTRNRHPLWPLDVDAQPLHVQVGTR